MESTGRDSSDVILPRRPPKPPNGRAGSELRAPYRYVASAPILPTRERLPFRSAGTWRPGVFAPISL
jgi:hypothetical protein